MISKLIKRSVVLQFLSVVLLTAEGRRYFSWRDLPEDRGYVGTRVAAIENRFVVYRLFAKLPIWAGRVKAVELDLQSTINMFTLSGVHHYTGLDDRYAHALCKLGHDWLGTGKSPNILQGMGLAELTANGWKV